MRQAARRLSKHLGRRGHFLLILGTGKTCWGLSFLLDPPDDDRGLLLLTRLGPIQSWAWLWVACGLVTFISAWLQVGRDKAGFVAALIPPTVWALAYTAAVIVDDYSRGAYVAIWYLTSHVGVIMWAATVPEHSVPPASRAARRGKTP